MSALAAWPAAYQRSEPARSRRRSKPPTQPATSGAPTHITAAEIAISWPPRETGTCRFAVRSLSTPTSAITPQPMTKFPNRNAWRTAPRRAVGSAAALIG